jgi:low affinity Fe/Cu permease
MLTSAFRRLSEFLQLLATKTTTWVGSSWAFVGAATLTICWLASGPLFRYSDTWQLVMNTISSIVTFLMVFLLQRSQNKEFMALQVKLNELIASRPGASNRLINAEDLSEEEVGQLHAHFQRLYERLHKKKAITGRASIEQEVKDNQESGSVPDRVP